MTTTYGGRWRHGDGMPVENVLRRSLLDKLGGELSRYQDKKFLKAAMAVCALTILADEEVKPQERRDIDHAIRTEPSFATFDIDKANEILEGYISELTSNGEEAKKILYDKVCRMAGDHKKARTLMRVSYLIITADCDVDDKEMAEFRRLCGMLELEPDEVWQNASIMRSF
jgi:tellurite resistance protein TerB